ncbi:ribonuclease E activity regulator RraA [Marinoscillum sp. 108]|uniref:ribonuclease E activity regulator RraA n=1 Tax=Marinoscillum sp. 108 TaxID=2653151 RepID=UPI0012EF352D|nr:ribonuclease E activity regulator RraA [Marinoscillum sp. 108]VXD12448.1 putative 4-hydroxy-4-methyl-2-oxoglutarate aldolase [Marinoscillum sp. 108]
MTFTTSDLWDVHGDALACAEPVFKSYGMVQSFHGQIVTLKLFEDNSLVRELLKTNGQGKVLCVDGGGSTRCALVGDLLAQLALDNQWSGLIIYGSIRDSAQIGRMPIGIKALNTCPVKSIKRNEGQINIPLNFAGVNFTPGQYVYSDADGIIVSEQPLL